ncbi:MAG: hypothetical protein WDM77_11575 [Steroidobacteraceae bacterium]
MGYRQEVVSRPVIDAGAASDIGIVSLGSCDGAVREALQALATRGVAVDYMRVRAFPLRRGGGAVSGPRTNSSSSSNRTVMRSCARC